LVAIDNLFKKNFWQKHKRTLSLKDIENDSQNNKR